MNKNPNERYYPQYMKKQIATAILIIKKISLKNKKFAYVVDKKI